MSKMWKIVIWVVVLVVLVLGLVGVAVAIRHGRAGWSFGPGRGGPQNGVRIGQLEVQLIDDDQDGIPDRGVVEPPAWIGRGEGGEGSGSQAREPQIAVALVDDDGDGIPDRGVIEGGGQRGFGPDSRLGPGNRFGPGPGRSFGPRWRVPLPFMIVGGLLRLACLAGIVLLGIFAYKRWWDTPPRPPVANTVSPNPMSPEPAYAPADATEPPAVSEDEDADEEAD